MVWYWWVLLLVLVYAVVRRRSYPTPWVLPSAPMVIPGQKIKQRGGPPAVYDLRGLIAPRLTGWKLKVLCVLAENPLVASLVLPKIMADSGFTTLETVSIEEEPTLYPLLELSSEEKLEVAKSSIAAQPFLPDLPALLTPLDKTVAASLSSSSSSSSSAVTTASGSTGASFAFPTIRDYLDVYQSNKATPTHVITKVLDSIDASNKATGQTPALRAFIFVDRESALRAAAASTQRYRSGKALPLDGVPIGVKDEIDVAGFRTMVGTQFMNAHPADADAEIIARLRAAGAIIIGKTNMHEIGCGVTGINPNPEHGICRNPYNLQCDTGGSSSGSGSAVAAGLCPVTIGADGGGSIRIPAALCGVVGLKPTYARVSEHGAAPLCWSVAHLGPLAATARDAAIVYAVIAGPDSKWPLTLKAPLSNLSTLTLSAGAGQLPSLHGLRVGVFWPWFKHADRDIVDGCEQMLKKLDLAGAHIQDVELSHLNLYRVAHVVTIVSEMNSNMMRHKKDNLHKFTPANRINLAIAERLSAHMYVQAQRVRTHAMRQLEAVLQQVDVIATPVTASLPPPIKADVAEAGESDAETGSKIMRFVFLPNLTGHPAIAFPVGYARGLPVSLQLIGGYWQEALLLRIAEAAEALVERRKPPTFYSVLP